MPCGSGIESGVNPIPITNGYITLAEIKAWFAQSTTDTLDDVLLEGAVNAASRGIDEFCGRRFWKDTSDVTRYFTAESVAELDVPDLVSITTLKTDDNGDRVYEITWATTDYDTEPEGGISGGVTGWPINRILTRPDKTRSFPTTRRAVEIAGVWGWNAVPADVKQACWLKAARLFKRKDAVFSVAGTTELGTISLRKDRDVVDLLSPFQRIEVLSVG